MASNECMLLKLLCSLFHLCSLSRPSFAVKTSATEVNRNDAPTKKRKTLYTLANEVIEESPENAPDKNVQLEMTSVPDTHTGTLTIVTTSTPYRQQLQPQETVETNVTETFSTNPKVASKSTKESDQFDLFGNFIAEVMRNMSRSKSSKLQLDIMGLIHETENAP